MKLICAVRDRAIDSFGTPIFVSARGEAMRSFVDTVTDPQSPFYKHPEDYDLYLLGAYDDATGELIPEKPSMLMTAKEIRAIERDPPKS